MTSTIYSVRLEWRNGECLSGGGIELYDWVFQREIEIVTATNFLVMKKI